MVLSQFIFDLSGSTNGLKFQFFSDEIIFILLVMCKCNKIQINCYVADNMITTVYIDRNKK